MYNLLVLSLSLSCITMVLYQYYIITPIRGMITFLLSWIHTVINGLHFLD